MLLLEDYQRYGRQMILDGFGLSGQLRLQQSSVVVVGAGGLGCPALQYLAAAGVGHLGIIDHDTVEISNLGRQILHSEETVGMYKAHSAALALKRLNSHVVVDAITEALTASNALALLESYDIILDCTDNVSTRYLLSDAAVLLRKPLVSGAAQKYEGQLCVYNLSPDGPCYRCLYPKPPAPEMVGSCEQVGILGAVTGIIGNLQAIETIKLITELHDHIPSLLLYSSLNIPSFRHVRLRKRKLDCSGCGSEGRQIKSLNDVDYVQFCGGPPPDWEELGLSIGSADLRVGAKEFAGLLKSQKKIRILDVRSTIEFNICQLPSSINVPLQELVANPRDHVPVDMDIETYVVCRLGNDSQIAVEALRSVFADGSRVPVLKDVIGGLRAWSRVVDPTFPMY